MTVPIFHVPFIEDEEQSYRLLQEQLQNEPALQQGVEARALAFSQAIRKNRNFIGGLDKFLLEYRPDSPDGQALMSIVEALPRIPDTLSADYLIKDKISMIEWGQHLKSSQEIGIAALTRALMWSRRMTMAGLTGVVREVVTQIVRLMAGQFIIGNTINEALGQAARSQKLYSFDILGEGACSQQQAEAYFQNYFTALTMIGRESANLGVDESHGLSIKLSALHPRFEFAQKERVELELLPKVIQLCQAAKQFDMALTIDAEELDRLELTQFMIANILSEPSLAGWDGFSVVLQAYQKRALSLVDWFADLSKAHNRRLHIRLVKGAYWDSEIRRAQEKGLTHYPVFTTKAGTDLSYLACAARIFRYGDRVFYGQFATHNAHTAAAILALGEGRSHWEFQRLFGMGAMLYRQIKEPICRIYAPIGQSAELLPYLIRRLFENGSNSSFVHQLADNNMSLQEIIQNPFSHNLDRRNLIKRPPDLFMPARKNSRGIDLHDGLSVSKLMAEIELASTLDYTSEDCRALDGLGTKHIVHSPIDQTILLGAVRFSTKSDVEDSCEKAALAFASWDLCGVKVRANIIEKAADMIEKARFEFMYLLINEAGKTIDDAVAEIREAIDFLRYYAMLARRIGVETPLPHVRGETNILSLHGRGVFAALSPWNFPLAIFLGQVAAALVMGNTVVAKPAPQTCLIAGRAARCLYEAGVPIDVFKLVLGGKEIGEALIENPTIKGVVFTGSTKTAKAIALALAQKEGDIVPLIAETGGLNAMIVDSSALIEQVVGDVMSSAFRSAGQRCSSLRILLIQDNIYDKLVRTLCEAVVELKLGNPQQLSTDIGPIIDADALARLQSYCHEKGPDLLGIDISEQKDLQNGLYFAPHAYEVELSGLPRQEVFGPVLHIARYDAQDLDLALKAVASLGYGLTLGIHSRLDRTIQRVKQHLPVGNTYINRNMIGAVVEMQPFGGQGRSGTGPKAGGPHYLNRFVTERVYTQHQVMMG